MGYPEHLRQEIDDYLAKLDFSPPEHTEQLVEAMQYSLLAPGKRVRPVLTLATARALRQETKNYYPFAAAVELIHTYSLIHDDLPAMDDDELRRGKPTCHVKYGEAVAILAGDALYAEAFAHVLSVQSGSSEHVIRAVRELAAASGVGGMVGGQYMDVTERIGSGIKALENLHSLKTGKLIEISILGPLLLAGSGEHETIQFRQFARELGVLFQIVDDILDVTGNEDELGKPQGSDQRHGKRTFVSEVGLQDARKYAADCHDRALSQLEKFDSESTEDLKAVTNFIYTRTT